MAVVRTLVTGTVGAGGLLFILSGITQRLPWGVPSASVLLSRAGPGPAPFATQSAVTLPPHALTTPAFDDAVVGRIATLTTDATFSWIVAQPIARYRPVAYLGREFATQLVVGLLLTLLLVALGPRSVGHHAAAAALAGGLACVATYGQLMNWWGLPPGYALGVSANLIVSWTIAAAVLSRFAPGLARP